MVEVPENLFDNCKDIKTTANTFRSCTRLKYGVIPESTETLTIDSMYLTNNAIEYVIVKPTTPPEFINTITGNNTFKVYVPDGSVEAYKTASGWRGFASRIYPLSQFDDDYPTLIAA